MTVRPKELAGADQNWKERKSEDTERETGGMDFPIYIYFHCSKTHSSPRLILFSSLWNVVVEVWKLIIILSLSWSSVQNNWILSVREKEGEEDSYNSFFSSRVQLLSFLENNFAGLSRIFFRKRGEDFGLWSSCSGGGGGGGMRRKWWVIIVGRDPLEQLLGWQH